MLQVGVVLGADGGAGALCQSAVLCACGCVSPLQAEGPEGSLKSPAEFASPCSPLSTQGEVTSYATAMLFGGWFST